VRSDEELAVELGEALRYLRRQQPVDEELLPRRFAAHVAELERAGLVSLEPSMDATLRNYVRTAGTSARIVKRYWLTARGENALRRLTDRRRAS
jgi:hypothetical protein